MQQLIALMLFTSREVWPAGRPALRPADTKRKILPVASEPFSYQRLSQFLLVAISASALFPLVRVDLMPFTFSAAGHRSSIYRFRLLQRKLRYHVLEFVRRLEHRHLPIRNRHDIPSAGIASLSSLSHFYLKSAKAPNLNVVSILDRFLHRIKK